uniref:C2H2-type domain-containing protein n=1 Tax=Zea mays TaxID=4577 RepID=A0A804NCC5_MAIZE
MSERRRRASAASLGGGGGGGVGGVAPARAEEDKVAAPGKAPPPTVWFAFKRSLHCRSEPSEVHVPRAKAGPVAGGGAGAAVGGGHLSSIVTKRAARSGCSRSIANLRDVIHGSKRHPGQPPSCSPRSIGSSEFLNPIAHEVVLSTNSRCELKITGFGGCGGLAAVGVGTGAANDADGGGDGGVVSSFVGTLRPGTPGPAWAGHGLPYSGSVRGSVRCTPPRSPNVMLERNGSVVNGHRASCDETAKNGASKGSGGLSCHKCGEQFSKWEALEAHHLSKHADTVLVVLLHRPPPVDLHASWAVHGGRWHF